MEFSEQGKENIYREQVRFVAHLERDTQFEPLVQTIKDYNGTGTAALHDKVFAWCAVEEDNAAIDFSGNNQYKIINQNIDVPNRKIMVEYTRPLDVPYDYSFQLNVDVPYKLWIQWGVFNGPYDIIQWKVKGMKANLKAT